MGVRMGSPGGSDAHPAFPGGRGGSVWATPASIIIAAFIVSGSLWTGPSSSPSLMRVRRDVDDQMFPGEDESTDLDWILCQRIKLWDIWAATTDGIGCGNISRKEKH